MAGAEGNTDLEAAACAAQAGRRVVVERESGKAIAVVPAEDLELIEELERREDADLLAASLEAEAKDQQPSAWVDVKRRLGLD